MMVMMIKLHPERAKRPYSECALMIMNILLAAHRPRLCDINLLQIRLSTYRGDAMLSVQGQVKTIMIIFIQLLDLESPIPTTTTPTTPTPTTSQKA